MRGDLDYFVVAILLSTMYVSGVGTMYKLGLANWH
jgi:hypothetical protein